MYEPQYKKKRKRPTIVKMHGKLEQKYVDEWVIARKNNKNYGLWTLVSMLSKRLPDRKSTRLNSSHIPLSRMPSSA